MAKGTVNKVILIGRLGAEPQVRYTPNNVPVVSVNIATNEAWTSQDGQVHERTDWHRIVLWRKLAEISAQYLHKGSKVYIEGKLQTRSYDDPNQAGVKRYITEIIADNMQMLETRQEGMSAEVPPLPEESDYQSGTSYNNNQSDNSSMSYSNNKPVSPLGADDDMDDLPF